MLIGDFAGLVELCLHGGVLIGEFVDGEALDLVVGETEVVVGLEEVLAHLLQVGDGLVDGGDGIVEAVVGVLDIIAELLLEL